MKRTEHYQKAENLDAQIAEILNDIGAANNVIELSEDGRLSNILLVCLIGSVRALTHATLANVRVREVDEIDNSDI